LGTGGSGTEGGGSPWVECQREKLVKFGKSGETMKEEEDHEHDHDEDEKE
jgi:hypothetical protein